MKAVLIGMLLASPPVAAWVLRWQEPTTQTTPDQPLAKPTTAPATVQIPVEVVSKGRASEWVYVEVPTQAVPEPGVTLLLPLASLLLLRRQRTTGK